MILIMTRWAAGNGSLVFWESSQKEQLEELQKQGMLTILGYVTVSLSEYTPPEPT